MARRTICIGVRDYVMDRTAESAGASGSDRAAVLRLSFDESWAGTTKTVYFTDARGVTSSGKVLGLLDLAGGLEDTYDVAIPASALAWPGRATMTVRGVILDEDGETEVVITTAAIDLKVPDSKIPETVGELGAVDQTAAEQLQAEIDGLKALFLTASSEAKSAAAAAGASEANAAASEDAAAASEAAAKSSETNAAASETAAKASEDAAKDSEDTAQAAATAAAASAAKAKASETAAAASETAAKASEDAAKSSETKAKASETAAKASETAAKASEDAAKSSEEKAGASEANAKASEGAAAASEEQAAYWATVAQGAAGGGVSTFNGRFGAVQPEAGDYTPEMVGADPAGTAAEAVAAHDADEQAHPGMTIGTDRLADGAVTGAKLGTGAVSTEKIAAKAVTAEKLGFLTADKQIPSSMLVGYLPGAKVYGAKDADGRIMAYMDAAHTISANYVVAMRLSDYGNALLIYDHKTYQCVGFEASPDMPELYIVAVFFRAEIATNDDGKTVLRTETARLDVTGYLVGSVSAPIVITTQELATGGSWTSVHQLTPEAGETAMSFGVDTLALADRMKVNYGTSESSYDILKGDSLLYGDALTDTVVVGTDVYTLSFQREGNMLSGTVTLTATKAGEEEPSVLDGVVRSIEIGNLTGI